MKIIRRDRQNDINYYKFLMFFQILKYCIFVLRLIDLYVNIKIKIDIDKIDINLVI